MVVSTGSKRDKKRKLKPATEEHHKTRHHKGDNKRKTGQETETRGAGGGQNQEGHSEELIVLQGSHAWGENVYATSGVHVAKGP